MPIRVLSRSSNERARKRGDVERFARPGSQASGLTDFHQKQRAPRRSFVPRRPALGLSVAQPNPSVANSLDHCVKVSTRSLGFHSVELLF
jgi:hypothetical protein